MNTVIEKSAYSELLGTIKARITNAQYEALKSVNKELIALYWDIGKAISERQKIEGWGKSIVERLDCGVRLWLFGFLQRAIHNPKYTNLTPFIT